MRAIAYLRVSTGLQAEKGMGLDIQREAVTEYAAAHELELVDVVQEAASGGVQNGEAFSWSHRPILLQLLDRAKAGEFDVLIVAKFDRLSRDDASTLIRLLGTGKHPVRVLSASENNGDSDEAELMRDVVGGFAKYERRVIRRRLEAGKQARKNQGRHVHGRLPYAYTSTKGELTPDAELEAIVVRIYAEAKQGRTPGTIARALNADAVPSPQDATWDRTAVRRILTNVAYAGERYGVKNAHPAIVTRRTFNAAQAALQARATDG